VQYRETGASGWSAVQSIALSSTVKSDDALALVAQRVASH